MREGGRGTRAVVASEMLGARGRAPAPQRGGLRRDEAGSLTGRGRGRGAEIWSATRRTAERFQRLPQRLCPAFHLHFRFRRGPEVGGRRRRLRAEEVEVVPGGRFPPPSRFGAEWI